MPIHTNVDQVVRLAIVGSLNDNMTVNVLHYIRSGITPINSAMLQAFITAWQADCQTPYLSGIAAQWTLRQYSARTVVEPSAQAELSVASIPGGVTGSEATANQVAGIISWRTGYAGRRRRGRTFMPAVPEDRLNAGRLTADLLTLRYLNFANAALQVTVDAVVYQLCILSDPSGHLPGSPSGDQIPAEASDVTSFIIRDVPGTIRRRRIGVGS
jgi:hypothetical protein